MDPTGNSSLSGIRENGKKTVASSANPKPNGKSTEKCRRPKKDAKKEDFRKYLEFSRVIDSLTKVVSYEQNDKSSSALESAVMVLLWSHARSYQKKSKTLMCKIPTPYHHAEHLLRASSSLQPNLSTVLLLPQ
ncbi:hypothetical protein Rs2_40684 [Raphanus sativus]|nr:hypothetical protein Rs2_40684 [Raphanus sativus]